MALIHHLLPRPLSHLRRSYFAILPNGSSEARPPPLNPGLRGHLRGHTRLGAPLLRKENQGVTRWCECANALDVRSPVSKAPLCARLKQHTRIPNRLLKNSSCRHSEEPPRLRSGQAKATRNRSEEHTSELQSLAYLVCRLLLEKKKITGRFKRLTFSINRPQPTRR